MISKRVVSYNMHPVYPKFVLFMSMLFSLQDIFTSVLYAKSFFSLTVIIIPGHFYINKTERFSGRKISCKLCLKRKRDWWVTVSSSLQLYRGIRATLASLSASFYDTALLSSAWVPIKEIDETGARLVFACLTRHVSRVRLVRRQFKA